MKLAQREVSKTRQGATRFFLVLRGLSLAIGLWCASNSFAERLPVKTYTVADGLLRDSVFKIKQDSRGFLWFCTREGVSRFDGYAFTNFTVADGLPERHANDFLETQDGTIYIATDEGLAKLNPTEIRTSVQRQNSQVQSSKFKVQRQNSPVQSANLPLFSVYLPDNERAQKITVLFEDENGQIFVGTSGGLYKLTQADGRTKFVIVHLGESPTGENRFDISAIIKNRSGAMWIGTSNAGLFRILPNNLVEHFGVADGLPNVSISVIREDKNGRVWVGLRPNKVPDYCFWLPSRRKIKRLSSGITGKKKVCQPIGLRICSSQATANSGSARRAVCASGKAEKRRFAKLIRRKTVCATRKFGASRKIKTIICGLERAAV